jgi:hypothetical protein
MYLGRVNANTLLMSWALVRTGTLSTVDEGDIVVDGVVLDGVLKLSLLSPKELVRVADLVGHTTPLTRSAEGLLVSGASRNSDGCGLTLYLDKYCVLWGSRTIM